MTADAPQRPRVPVPAADLPGREVAPTGGEVGLACGEVALPGALLAPWRSVPRLAGVLAGAFAPAAARRWGLAGVLWPLWLMEAAVQRCSGRLMAVGPSVLVLRPGRTAPGSAVRRALLLVCAVALWWALLVATALAGGVAGRAGFGDAGTRWGPLVVLWPIGALMLWQLSSLLPAGRAGVRLRHEMRTRALDGRWVEVASLAGGGMDGQATRDLARALLEWADDGQVALVAVAATPRLERLYARAGFTPLSAHSPVLLRPPRAPGTPWRPHTAAAAAGTAAAAR